MMEICTLLSAILVVLGSHFVTVQPSFYIIPNIELSI